MANKPTIILVSPKNLSIDIALNATITASFANGTGYYPIDGNSINGNSVYLTDNTGTKVPGTVSCTGNTISFKPTNNLSPSKPYIMNVIGDLNADNISEGVKDISNNALVGTYTWSFTTIASLLEVPALLTPGNSTVQFEIPSLTWSDVSATTYEVQISTKADFSIINWTTTTAAKEAVPNITEQTNYYWRVRATKDTIITEWSPTQTFSLSTREETTSTTADFYIISSYPKTETTNLSELKSIEVLFSRNIDETTINGKNIILTKIKNN